MRHKVRDIASGKPFQYFMCDFECIGVDSLEQPGQHAIQVCRPPSLGWLTRLTCAQIQLQFWYIVNIGILAEYAISAEQPRGSRAVGWNQRLLFAERYGLRGYGLQPAEYQTDVVVAGPLGIADKKPAGKRPIRVELHAHKQNL